MVSFACACIIKHSHLQIKPFPLGQKMAVAESDLITPLTFHLIVKEGFVSSEEAGSM